MIESTCMGEKHRNTPRKLMKMYESWAYAAESAGNTFLAHTYFQQAEWLKKLQRGER